MVAAAGKDNASSKSHGRAEGDNPDDGRSNVPELQGTYTDNPNSARYNADRVKADDGGDGREQNGKGKGE